MNGRQLLALAGFAALAGGLLRVVSAFIPFTPDHLILELFYGVIDVALLAGLVGLYIDKSEDFGLLGFAGFAAAFIGLAAIVGPDPVFAGIDTYQIGVLIIVSGLAVLSAQIIRTRCYPRFVAVLWLAAPAASIIGPALGLPAQGFVLGAIAFGLGFAVAGAALLRRTAPQRA